MNYTIELLRFIFCFFIVVFHFQQVVEGLNGYFYCGYFGVEFFFLVSGYLLAKSAMKYNEAIDGTIWNYNVRVLLKKIRSFFMPCFLMQIMGFILKHIINGTGSIKNLLSDLYAFPFDVLLLRQWGFEFPYYISVTWYLSAMLIVIFVCFPLLLKNREKYTLYLAPIISLFILGVFSHIDGNICGTGTYWIFIHKSTLRAFAVMNMGIILYSAVDKLKQIKLSRRGKNFLLFVELISFMAPLCYCVASVDNVYDFESLLFLCIGIVISYLDVTNLDAFINNHCRIPKKLGNFSLFLFLTNFPICTYIMPVIKLFVSDVLILLSIYILIVFVSSWMLMVVSEFINNNALVRVKSFFIEKN